MNSARSEEIKRRIEAAISRYASAVSRRAYALVPGSMTAGKLYEAHVLSIVLENLYDDENFQINLINTEFLPLKSSPGPINQRYPHFDLYRGRQKVAEL